jgi:hypothetical protein
VVAVAFRARIGSVTTPWRAAALRREAEAGDEMRGGGTAAARRGHAPRSTSRWVSDEDGALAPPAGRAPAEPAPYREKEESRGPIMARPWLADLRRPLGRSSVGALHQSRWSDAPLGALLAARAVDVGSWSFVPVARGRFDDAELVAIRISKNVPSPSCFHDGLERHGMSADSSYSRHFCVEIRSSEIEVYSILVALVIGDSLEQDLDSVSVGGHQGLVGRTAAAGIHIAQDLRPKPGRTSEVRTVDDDHQLASTIRITLPSPTHAATLRDSSSAPPLRPVRCSV